MSDFNSAEAYFEGQGLGPLVQLGAPSINFSDVEGTNLTVLNGGGGFEIFAISLGADKHRMTGASEWSSLAPNVYNQHVFSWMAAHPEGAGEYDYFQNSPFISFSTAGLFNCFLGHSSIRMLEIGTGPRSKHEGQVASLLRTPPVEIVRTDISTIDPGEGSLDLQTLRALFNVSYRSLDLLQPLPFLPAEKRAAAVMGFYVFDSLVLPGDRCFAYVGDQWFLAHFRVEALSERGLKILAGEENELCEDPKNDIFLSYSLEPIDIDREPFAEHLKGAARGPRGYLWLPGGMTAKIKELFDTTITDDGILLLGAAAFEESSVVPGVPFTLLSSGPFFKVDSFLLAGELLKMEGFEIGAYGMRLFFEDFGQRILDTVPELKSKVNPNYLNALIDRGERWGQGVLIVKRKE